MKPEEKTLRFLLGANTPQGFVSRFDQLGNPKDGWRSFVIKGGPGCGKSTMMKIIADKMQKEGEQTEVIHCASDIESLDAVIVPSKRFSIADGTLPHSIELRYPGAFEQLVDMSSCFDNELLFKNRMEIIALTDDCTKCHQHCCRFLAAAGSLISDTYRLALDCVNTQKLSGYCARLAEKEFKMLKKGTGKESVRFISSVTNKGIIAFTDTAKILANRIYVVQDEHGAVSRLILNSVRANALATGYDIISCYCPLSPYEKLEQIFIPSLGLGFMTSNRFHDFSDTIDPYRIVNSQRFTDNEKLKASKKRILFNRKAAAQMIKQAQTLLGDAKQLHDKLESYYIAAIDYKKVNAMTSMLVEKISNI